MGSYVLEGIPVKVPARALRPREPARPAPARTMASPEVGKRWERPRTAKDVQPKESQSALARMKAKKAQQAAAEKKLRALVEELKRVRATANDKQLKALQSQIDALIEQIKRLAAEANTSALVAVEKGATQQAVKDIAKAIDPVQAPPQRAPVSEQAPVIETSTPALLPDGTIVPGSDAKVIDEATGAPSAPAAAGDKADGEGMGTLTKLALAAGALFLVSRAMR